MDHHHNIALEVLATRFVVNFIQLGEIARAGEDERPLLLRIGEKSYFPVNIN
jgi:hypothetical protein